LEFVLKIKEWLRDLLHKILKFDERNIEQTNAELASELLELFNVVLHIIMVKLVYRQEFLPPGQKQYTDSLLPSLKEAETSA